MKSRNLLICFLAATILFLPISPLAAAETGDRTVLLQVYVPSTSG